MIIDLLRSLLYEPRVRNIDVNDDKLLDAIPKLEELYPQITQIDAD